MRRRSNRSGSLLLTAVLGLGVSTAQAQETGTSSTATPPPPVEQPPPAEVVPEPPIEGGPIEGGGVVEGGPVDQPVEPVPEKKASEELIVTGSRIRRLDLVTPAPVAVLTKQELQDSGLSNIGQILQNLPSQSNAINIQTNNGGDGSTRINLRGLGERRTLVLVNGRRFVPGGTGANSSVDLNSIPIGVIDRVEVLKDGASAVYGSDAIGGVVNIITKKDFSGVEGSVYVGSGQVGGLIYDLSVTAGHTTEKGNILFSFSLYDQDDIFAAERDFSNPDRAFDYEADANMDGMPDCMPNCDSNIDGTRVTPLGSSATPQSSLFDYGDDELLLGSSDNVGNAEWDALKMREEDPGAYFNDPVDGWRTYDGSGTRDTGSGDAYNYQPENYLLTPSQRYSLFAIGSYDVFEQVSVYGEASYTNRQSDQLLAPEPLFIINEGLVASANNPYNPFGRDFVDIRRRFSELGPRRFIQDLDTYRAVVGLEGGLPGGLSILSDWRWDGSFTFGRTEGTEIKEGLLVRPRLANALGPGFIDGGGVPQCGSPTAPIAGCVPLDLFGGEGAITPDMLNYVTYTGTRRGFSQQQIVDLGVSGPLFSLFEREIALAIGYQFRDEAGGVQPDPITESGDTTGNKEESTNGGYNVNAVYGELSIPLHFDIPAVETLELTGALRWVNIKPDESPTITDPVANSEVTWKAGARWQLFEHVALRGSASKSFRAPSVLELFSGQFDDFPQVDDPCNTINAATGEPRTLTAQQMANCAREGVPSDLTDNRNQFNARVGGNPELEPETANVFTAGVVFTPKFGPYIDGLSLTVDYWTIDIDNAIQDEVGSNVLLANCYSVDPAQSTDCDKIIRNAAGQIDNIIDTAANIGGVETAGIDIGLAYRLNTDFGQFRYSFDATYLQKYNEIQPDPENAEGRVVEGKNVYDLGVFPDWKFNTTLAYGIYGFTVGFNVRFVNSFQECENDDCSNLDLSDDINEDGTIDQMDLPLSREIDSYVTADIFAAYRLAWDYGLTDIGVGINNLSDTTPPFIDNGFTANSDESVYDYIGRYFYVRLAHTF